MKSDNTRINEEIRAKEVRLISEDGEQLGIMSVNDALNLASEKNLDLVEMSYNGTTSVAKIMDYGKYRYEKVKKDKENKKKQKNTVIKEIRVKPHIDTHDMETKVNQIEKFLEKDYKIKISLRLSGREKLHSETAVKVLDEFANFFEEKVVVEKKYGKEQVQKFVMLSPKKQFRGGKIMPKMKTHKGAKKRIKVTGTGKFVVKHSGKSHILTKKTHKRKKRLGEDAVLTGGAARKASRLLAGQAGR